MVFFNSHNDRQKEKTNVMAKKVKNSKFNVIGQDPLTEQMLGEGAVRLNNCRMLIKDGEKVEIEGVKINKIGLYGIAIDTPNMVNGDEVWQMWDCEIYIVPRKKYRKSNFFKGSKADQIMNHGSMGNPKLWEEEIFGAAEQHPMDIKK